MTQTMSFFQVRSVATIVTGKPCTRFVRRPAIIPNSSSIFTREVTVHSLEASVGMVIRRTNILHPDRATNHEHDTRSNNNSNHLRRQTVTRWDDALLVLCGRSKGHSSVIFVNSVDTTSLQYPASFLLVVDGMVVWLCWDCVVG